MTETLGQPLFPTPAAAGTVELVDWDARARRIAEIIAAYRYLASAEADLQNVLEQLLTAHGLALKREHIATARDRFDFLVDEGVVVEAKTQGSLPTALVQCDRYAALPVTRAIVLASSKGWARQANVHGQSLRGKPLYVVYIRPAAF